MGTVSTPADFGATGDGVTDDTPHLQAMFDDARGNTVLFDQSATTYLASRVVIRADTRVLGAMQLASADSSVDGVVFLERGVSADSVTIRFPARSPIQRGVYVSGACRLAYLAVIGVEPGTGVINDNRDGMIQISGDDIWLGQVVSRNCDWPIVARSCNRLTIEHVDIETYCRGSLFVYVSNLHVGSYRCRGRSPNTSPDPGRDGISMGAMENAVFNGVIVEDAGEHGIYHGNGGSTGITFVSPIVRRSARSGFKVQSQDGYVYRLSLVSPLILDCAVGSRPGTNEDGIRLIGVRNCTITSPVVSRKENTVSAHDGIYLSNCEDVAIDGARVDSAARHGIVLEATHGLVNSIYLRDPIVSNCGHTGIRIEGSPERHGILRNITLTRCYVRGCAECGVACVTGSSTSGVNQPVLLDGWIKDSGTGKLIVSDPDVHDRLEILD